MSFAMYKLFNSFLKYACVNAILGTTFWMILLVTYFCSVLYLKILPHALVKQISGCSHDGPPRRGVLE